MNCMCLFCKILKKEIPANVVYEDDIIIAFKDVKPIAPIHILIIPKKHISSLADIKIEDVDLIGKLMLTAKKIAEDLNIAQKGYKLVMRVGKDGGQEIGHIHLHLLGGTKL